MACCRRTFIGMLASAGVGALGMAVYDRHNLKPIVKACKLAGTPLDELHTYLCAFHVAAKDWPKGQQVEAHHYCMSLQSVAGMFQCLVLDSNQPGARILGVEYIATKEVLDKICAAAPDAARERQMWHPHDYEVTSGLLVAPNMTRPEEDDFMKTVKGTWGKTIHTWADAKCPYPVGTPELMMAFTKDGQIRPELIKARDEALKMSTDEVKKHRAK